MYNWPKLLRYNPNSENVNKYYYLTLQRTMGIRQSSIMLVFAINRKKWTKTIITKRFLFILYNLTHFHLLLLYRNRLIIKKWRKWHIQSLCGTTYNFLKEKWRLVIRHSKRLFIDYSIRYYIDIKTTNWCICQNRSKLTQQDITSIDQCYFLTRSIKIISFKTVQEIVLL